MRKHLPSPAARITTSEHIGETSSQTLEQHESAPRHRYRPNRVESQAMPVRGSSRDGHSPEFFHGESQWVQTHVSLKALRQSRNRIKHRRHEHGYRHNDPYDLAEIAQINPERRQYPDQADHK